MTQRLGHRPALDGVRALAIVAVMGLHTIDRLFKGGFFGVDIFFVLSAFLITSLILEELEARGGRYSFRSFYSRRALRLGPALFVWLLLIAAPTAIALHEVSQIPIATVASLFYFGDFAQAAGLKLGAAYTHVWSLAVEEQFYAVWPLVLVALLFRRKKSTIRRILVCALAGSFGLSIVAAHQFSGNYFLPTGHLLPLAAGCLAAFLFMDRSAAVERLLRQRFIGPACLGVLTLIIVSYRPLGTYGVPLAQAAVALAAGALLLHVCLRPAGLAATLLSRRPAIWLGRRSYGLYLYHRTLTLLIPALIPGIQLRYAGPLVVLLAFVLAELSFRLVERPINIAGREWLRRKSYASVRPAEFTLPVTAKSKAPEVADIPAAATAPASN